MKKDNMEKHSDTFSVNTDDFYDDYEFESDDGTTVRSSSPLPPIQNGNNNSTENSEDDLDAASPSQKQQNKNNTLGNSFESSSSKSSSIPVKTKRNNLTKESSRQPSVNSHVSAQTRSTVNSRRTTQSNYYNQNKIGSQRSKKSWQRSSLNGSYGSNGSRPIGRGNAPPSKPQLNQITKRVMSAKRKNMGQLQNHANQLEMELEKLRVENKDLKKIGRIQEKALSKLDNDEAEIPRLIQKHGNEIRVLREKVRKSKETTDRSLQELKRKDTELLRLKDKTKRLEEIVEGKNLYQKDKINKQFEELQEKLQEKDSKLLELEKTIALHAKVRQREMKDRNEKYKKAKEELKQVEGRYLYLQQRLKEKEKELETKNLYSQAIIQKRRQEGWRNPDSPFSERQLSATSTQLNAYITGTSPVTKRSPREIGHSPKMETVVGKHRQNLNNAVDYEQQLKARLEEKIRLDIEREKEFKESEEKRIREELQQREIRQRLEEENAKREEFRKKDEQDLRDFERLREMERKIKQEVEDKLAEQERRRLERDHETKQMNEQNQMKELDNSWMKQEANRLLAEKEKEIEKQRKENEKEQQQFDEEFEEANRKKALLLERMRAIDDGKDPNEVNEVPIKQQNGANQNYTPSSQTNNSPIFLQSNKSEPTKFNNEPQQPTSNGVYKTSPNDFLFNDKKEQAEVQNQSSNNDNYIPTFADSKPKKQITPKNEDIVFGSYRPSLGMKDTEPENFYDGKGKPVYGRRGAPQGSLNGSNFSDDNRSPSPMFDLSATSDGKRNNQPRQRNRPAANNTTTNVFGDDLFGSSSPIGSDSASRSSNSQGHKSRFSNESRTSSGGSRPAGFRGPRSNGFNHPGPNTTFPGSARFDDGVEELIIL